MELQEETTEVENPSVLGLIHQPREQFTRIRDNPKVIVALIIVTLIAIVTALLTVGGAQAALEAELLGLTDEEMELFTLMTQIVTVVLATIVPALVILVGATVYFIIAKIADRDVSFKQMFSLFTYIAFITGIGGLINGVLTYFIGGANPEISYFSLQTIFGADGALEVVFSSIELFKIWSIILTALGLQIVANFSKRLAWGTVIGLNVLLIIATALLAVIGQSIGI